MDKDWDRFLRGEDLEGGVFLEGGVGPLPLGAWEGSVDWDWNGQWGLI